MSKRYDTNKKVILLVGDLALITLSIYLSVALRLSYINVFDYYTGATTFMVLTYLLSFYAFDLYNLRYRFKSTAYLARFLFAVIAGTGFIAMTFYLFPAWKFGRGIFIINMIFISIFCFAWRLSFRILFLVTTRQRVIAIIGAGHQGRAIYDALQERNFSVKGFLDDDPEKANELIGSHSVIGGSKLLTELAQKKEVDAVVMAVSHEKDSGLLKALINAKMYGIEIYNMASLFEELTGKLPVLHLSDGWMAFTPFHGTRRGIYTAHVKRLIDVGLSCAGLLISLPVTIATAAAIKMDSRGPVLFRQKRIGFDGKAFELIKFRSMSVEAETQGPLWATENDPRVTKVGKVIRKTRIDEIPQMWNVLRGDMSFIGPRPERPEFVEELNEDIPFYFFRHAVKPGITGWAQVNFRYGASKEDSIEKLQYDLFYIKNLSAFLDFTILLRTIEVVLFGKGAR